MDNVIEVYIDHGGSTTLVGHCRHIGKSERSSSLFEYADSWLTDTRAFALDPANLPLSRHQYYRTSRKSALPGAIRDGAPDRWGRQLIRRAVLKSGARKTLTEVDYLLGVTDNSRIGALRFRRTGDSGFSQTVGKYRIPPLVQLPALLNAAAAVQYDLESGEDLRLLLYQGSPLGGARPKSAVIDNDGSLAIAKFPKPSDVRSIPHGEVMALSLARKAGLNAASGRLEIVAGNPVALIRRFDRVGKQRIPFLSAMSLLGLDDGDTATYTDIAELIRMYSAAPKVDLHELWRRVVLGVMIGNLDDHLRNHGFLHAGDNQWRLSPAYDLNPVPLHEKARELTTWISEEGPEANLELAFNAAPYFALNLVEAKQIVSQVSTVVTKWCEVARGLQMTAADMATYATAIVTDA